MAEARPISPGLRPVPGPAHDAARAQLRGRRPAGAGAADPARRGDRGAVSRHRAADHRGGRAAARERPDRHPRRSARSTPSSPAARSSTSIPGLLTAADNANEVQGVVAHELGHIAGGHVIRMAEGVRQATGIMILSLLLGAAAMAAGAGDAGMAAIMAAGQQAAMGKLPRLQPRPGSSADQAGATFLSRAGISGQGMLAFFRSCRTQEYPRCKLRISRTAYAHTHPLTVERIQALEQALQGDRRLEPADRPGARGALPAGQAKLSGYVDDPQPGPASAIPRATRAIPPIMPALMPGTGPAYPDKADGRSGRLAAGRARTIPISSSSRARSCSKAASPQEALGVLREAVAARARPAADRGPARPRPDRDRGSGEFRRGQARAAARGRRATMTIPSPGTSSASSTTARATRRAPRSRPPSATISKATQARARPMPSGR